MSVVAEAAGLGPSLITGPTLARMDHKIFHLAHPLSTLSERGKARQARLTTTGA